MAKYDKKKIDDYRTIITNNAGLIKPSCDSLYISRRTFYNWLEKYPEFKEAYDDAQEEVLDTAESQLYELVKDKNLGAICFVLKCKGKKRGYVERETVNEIYLHSDDIRQDVTSMGETVPNEKVKH